MRELENVIQRATVLAQGGVISEDHIRFAGTDGRRLIDIGERVRRGIDLPGMLEDIERTALEEAMSATDGDRKDAASLLGISLTDMNKRAKALGL